MGLPGFRQHLFLASLITLGIAVPSGGATENPSQGPQVAARVVSFLVPPPKGTLTAAIVYNPADPSSASEAASIERDLRGDLKVGSFRLAPKRVVVNALNGLAGAKVAFVTRGVNYAEVAAAAAPLSILTISFDPACAKAGRCIVSIAVARKVEITVSRAARKASNVTFNSAFMMLVKEI